MLREMYVFLVGPERTQTYIQLLLKTILFCGRPHAGQEGG